MFKREYLFASIGMFLVGVARKCHSFCFMECLLDFLESHGLHVFRWLIFIGLTVGVFFFSQWNIQQSAVVPLFPLYRICGSGQDGPIGRRAYFQGDNKGMDPLFMVG